VSYSYHTNDILVKPIFLSGTKKSGKSLIYSLLKSFGSIEGVCKDFFLNHLFQLNKDNRLSNDVADFQIKNFLNFKFYESAIGRNLNTRIDDETSIWESPYVHQEFLKLLGNRGPKVATNLSKRRSRFVIDSHNLFLYINEIDRIYHNYYFINVNRSPASILTSWIRDTLYSKESLNGILSQQLCLKIQNDLVPLILPKCSHIDFINANIADRCALVYFYLHKKEEAFENSTKKSHNFLNLSFEKTLLNPHETYKNISSYLSKIEYKEIQNIFITEQVPRLWSFDDEIKKLGKLKDMLSNENYQTLKKIFNIWAEKNDFP